MKKALFGILLAIIIIKILLSILIQVPLGYSDSLGYFEQAKIFFETGSITKIIETAKFPPLYAVFLSPAYFFNDMNTVFFLMKMINALISSLVLIPTYLLAKEFLSSKKSLMIATAITLFPTIFLTSFYILSESLFLLIVMSTVYVLYKAYAEGKIYWKIAAGIGMGLAFLTRINGLFLFPIPLLMILFSKKRDWKTAISIFIVALLILSPWIYAKMQTTSTEVSSREGPLGGYYIEFKNIPQYLPEKAASALMYIEYLIIGLAILPFLFFLSFISSYKKRTEKEKIFLKLILFISLCTIIIAANNVGSVTIDPEEYSFSDHRIIGRYLSQLFPLFLLVSCIAVDRIRIIKKKHILATALFIAIGTPFFLFGTFFPFNNKEWIHIELFKILTNYPSILSIILITSFLTIITVFFWKKRTWKTKHYIFFLLFYAIAISTINTAAVIYDAQEHWYPLEEVQLGIWITKNIEPEATFYFDPEDLEYFEEASNTDRTDKEDRPITVIAYWIRGEITNIRDILNGNPKEIREADYIITTKDLDLELIKKGETIHIYKNA